MTNIINMERMGDNVYCSDNNHNVRPINMKGVDEDIFWDTAKEEAMEIYKDAEYDLHIQGFRL